MNTIIIELSKTVSIENYFLSWIWPMEVSLLNLTWIIFSHVQSIIKVNKMMNSQYLNTICITLKEIISKCKKMTLTSSWPLI